MASGGCERGGETREDLARKGENARRLFRDGGGDRERRGSHSVDGETPST